MYNNNLLSFKSQSYFRKIDVPNTCVHIWLVNQLTLIWSLSVLLQLGLTVSILQLVVDTEMWHV